MVARQSQMKTSAAASPLYIQELDILLQRPTWKALQPEGRPKQLHFSWNALRPKLRVDILAATTTASHTFVLYIAFVHHVFCWRIFGGDAHSSRNSHSYISFFRLRYDSLFFLPVRLPWKLFSIPGALIFELFGFIASLDDLAATDRPSGGAPPKLFPKWQCIDIRLCLAAVSRKLMFASSLISKMPTILTSTRALGSSFIWINFLYIFFTIVHRTKRILWSKPLHPGTGCFPLWKPSSGSSCGSHAASVGKSACENCPYSVQNWPAIICFCSLG